MELGINLSVESAAIPTERDLLLFFNEKRRNEHYVAPVEELINMLGGIDVVMNEMLSSPNYRMSPEMREKMYVNICNFEPTYRAQAVQLSVIRRTSQVSEDQLDHVQAGNQGELTWTLDPKDNWLQAYPWLTKCIYSKYMFLLIGLLWITQYVLFFSLDLWRFQIYWTFIMFVFITWTIVALLSVNKQMIPRIVCCIDFWIIIIAAAILVMYSGIYYFKMYDNPLSLQIVFTLIAGIIMVLFFALVCSMDGIHQCYPRARIYVTTIFALWILFRSLYYRFFVPECIVHIHVPVFRVHIWNLPVANQIAHTYEILFIFLGKQALKTWSRGRRRCAVVQYSPFIEWTDSFQYAPTPRDDLDESDTEFSEVQYVRPESIGTMTVIAGDSTSSDESVTYEMPKIADRQSDECESDNGVDNVDL